MATKIELFDPSPTGATLAYFRATTVGQGRVLLAWGTLIEVRILGFHAERSVSTGGWERVTPSIIPAAAQGDWPQAYRHTDTTAPAPGGGKYRLLVVDLSGHEGVLAEATVSPGLTVGIAGTATGFRLDVQGEPNAAVVVETTADLADSWTQLESVTLDGAGAGGLILPVDPGERARFYRVRWD